MVGPVSSHLLVGEMIIMKLTYCLCVNLTLFVLGFLGVVLNKKSILVTLMSIEIALLSVSLNFITSSVFLNDAVGEVFVIFILAIAASESAIALAIIVSICRYRELIDNVLLTRTWYVKKDFFFNKA
jgi:NADH-quinone oxidoreductase subunit K